ncbi:AraC family transcriptional regulator [Shimia biformata]|uniref:AraC family transcriptional regulator n=1 Tax=Shimia biformata TaxID=1294299 RepID=UPI00194EDA3F|nr:AraC family transcriptional regulator [Shimia biformata]
MNTYIRAAALAVLKTYAQDHGLPLRPIMARYRLAPEVLDSADREIPFLSAIAILEECAREWQIPDLGVQLGKKQSFDAIGVVALVVRMERTVRDAVQAVLRNLFLHTNAVIVELRELPGGKYAELSMDVRSEGTGARQYREMSLCGVKNDLIAIAGRNPVFVKARVPHGPSKGREILSRELNCPVEYHARSCAVVFEADILDLAIPQSDIAFHPIIKRYLVEATQEKQRDFTEVVRLEIFRQMSSGEVSQDKVADAMRLQKRTLQRRLKEAGTSFRELLDGERKRKALTLVQQTRLSMFEVAMALGYSDQTAFNQAFKRWYGRNPLAIRREDDRRTA